MAGYMWSRSLDDLLRFMVRNPGEVSRWMSQFRPRGHVVVADDLDALARALHIARDMESGKLKPPKASKGYDIALWLEARRLQVERIGEGWPCSDYTAIQWTARRVTNDIDSYHAMVQRLWTNFKKKGKTLEQFADEYETMLSKISRLK
jgi:hypothetical protein